MKMSLFRGEEILREPRFVPATTYNLAHTLLTRSNGSVFVPIRAMQYLAIVDLEEIVFIDREASRVIQLAWQHFKPQSRTALDERVPYEVVYYLPGAQETMIRLQSEFPRALQLLSARNRPASEAVVLDLRDRVSRSDDG
ncbi:MAG: hypothetical protein ACLPXB_19625 [Thiobacillaceae bacterium]|jgi:hypothetical protein